MIYSTPHHTCINTGNNMQWYFTRTLYNILCAAWLGVTAIQHEITTLVKYSPRLYIVTFHLDAQRPLKGESSRMPLN